MGRILRRVLLVAGMVMATGSAAASASSLSVPLSGDALFPESITAAPNGALFVSSLATGEIVRLAPGSHRQTTFVDDDVNVGTAGVMVDRERNVLWACAVDLTFQTTSELRAFDLRTGSLEASYEMPDGGVCADIAIARGDLYVTDTGGGRIVRLTTPDRNSAGNGTLTVWSDDAQLADGAFLKINGIAFDGRATLYTTNYSTGDLFAIRIGACGDAEPAVQIELDTPLTNPDGIRWRDNFLYVADNATGVLRVDPRTGKTKVIYPSPDQTSSLVFVDDDVWITEGQIFHIQTGDPMLPFNVVRLRL